MARFKMTFLVIALVALVLCAIGNAFAREWDNTAVAVLAAMTLLL